MSYEGLIRVFSKHSVAEIEPDGVDLVEQEFVGQDYQKLCEDEAFKKEYELVRGARERLDRILNCKPALSPETQLHRCLEIELKHQRAPLFDVLQQLIPVVLMPGWPDEVKKLYDIKHEVLFDWQDYFISYTTRQAGKTNEQFKELIESYMAFYPDKKERTKYNYVARILDEMLRVENLSGFLDENKLKSGDELKDRIFDYCRKTCAFIQLQEKVIFSQPPGQRNWCLDEYYEFKNNPRVKEICKDQTPSHRHHFLLTLSKPTKPAKWPDGEEKRYEEWWDHANAVKHVSISSVDVDVLETEIAKIAVIVDSLHEKLVRKVMDYA